MKPLSRGPRPADAGRPGRAVLAAVAEAAEQVGGVQTSPSRPATRSPEASTPGKLSGLVRQQRGIRSRGSDYSRRAD
jgi:hypothetical protein